MLAGTCRSLSYHLPNTVVCLTKATSPTPSIRHLWGGHTLGGFLQGWPFSSGCGSDHTVQPWGKGRAWGRPLRRPTAEGAPWAADTQGAVEMRG